MSRIAQHVVMVCLAVAPVFGADKAETTRNVMSVCTITASPDDFNGKIVTLTGELRPGMHATSLVDSSCAKSLLLEYPNLNESGEIALSRDEKFEKFELWMNRVRYQPEKDRYRIHVTVTGRFDFRAAPAKGFGDHSLGRARLVLARVSEVRAEDKLSKVQP